jgi:hypothetical protein
MNSEARALITGCNHTDKSHRLIYEIHLASGESFDLGGTKTFRGNKISAVEEINATIDPSIEHRRWSHLDRDPVHPACLTAWAQQFDGDGEGRQTKLLRLSADRAARSTQKAAMPGFAVRKSQARGAPLSGRICG